MCIVASPSYDVDADGDLAPVDDRIRPYVIGLLRLMIIECGMRAAESGSGGAMSESTRHLLATGHRLRYGCCRQSGQQPQR